MSIQPEIIHQIHSYLCSEQPLVPADGVLIFGRCDPLLAKRAAELIELKLATYCLFLGGIGKDSGLLKDMNYPEALFLASIARWHHGISDDKIYVEPRPANGGESSRMAIDFVRNHALPHKNLIILTHPALLRRTLAIFGKEALNKRFEGKIQGTTSNSAFNSQELIHQKECVSELIKLADWPAKQWSLSQSDLPLALVEKAREYEKIIQ